MSKMKDNQLILTEKDKKFLIHYYSEGKSLGESYILASGRKVNLNVASKCGHAMAKRLESFEDYRSIIRQFSPIPTLGAHMADIAFSSKDPNLRYKGQTHITRVLGLQEPEVGTVQGFTINIAGAKQAIQLNQGDSSDSDAKTTQPKKLGRPISFIK